MKLHNPLPPGSTHYPIVQSPTNESNPTTRGEMQSTVIVVACVLYVRSPLDTGRKPLSHLRHPVRLWQVSLSEVTVLLLFNFCLYKRSTTFRVLNRPLFFIFKSGREDDLTFLCDLKTTSTKNRKVSYFLFALLDMTQNGTLSSLE